MQNAGIVQALCNTPGSKDSSGFSHIAPLYAVLIFTSCELDLGVPKFACIRHVVIKEGAVVYFHLLERRRCNKLKWMLASISQRMLCRIVALENIPQKGEKERDKDIKRERKLAVWTNNFWVQLHAQAPS